MKEDMQLPHWKLKLEDISKAGEPAPEEKPDDSFRPISVKCGVFEEGRGSAYIEMGSTKVLAQIEGPRESSSASSRSSLISVQLQGGDENLRADLLSALSALVHLDKYPKSEFIVKVCILAECGGELAVAVLASSLAFIHASLEMVDMPVAAHLIRLSDGRLIVDPPRPYPDDATSFTVAFMPNLNQVVTCDIRGFVSLSEIKRVVRDARKHALRLYPVLRRAVETSLNYNKRAYLS